MGKKNLIDGIRNIIISNLHVLLLLLLLIPFYYILYKIYIPKLAAFGCFDDCFNYVGGYFIANGKHIYKDFFFNHQLIPPLISYFIQEITNPINIYDLLLKHRQFLMLFGLFFNALLILRFKSPAFLFVLFYELSKFYIFGDRFLAEGMIVYPVVYLFGICLLKLTKQKTFTIDYILSGIFTWFIVFSREPYIPLVIFLFIVILWGKQNLIKKISILIFTVLSALTLLYISDLKEYFFNIVTFNIKGVINAEPKTNLFGPKIFHIFFYPIYVLLFGEPNIFKNFLTGIDILFLAFFAITFKKRNFALVLFIFLSLGLANFRVVTPDTIFYEAFHLINWFALLLFSLFLLIFLYQKPKILKFTSLFLVFLILFSLVFHKQYFGYEKKDIHPEFLTNYGYLLHTGEAVKVLSNNNNSLYLDGSEDLIYWQAKRMSSYKYVWYTSLMPKFEKYRGERIEMFRKTPPDFYVEFGVCPKNYNLTDGSLPGFVRDQYVRLYSGNDPTCVYVKKTKLKDINDIQWKKAGEFINNLNTKIIN